MQHKSPIVEELEDRLLALGAHRAKAAAERAEADAEEEERPASAAVQAAMGVIARGGAMPGAPLALWPVPVPGISSRRVEQLALKQNKT